LDFLSELRRRSVFRVTAAYLVAAWVVMQVIGFVADASTLPAWTTTFVLILVIAGLPIVIIVAWAFELTPEGPKLTGPRAEGETIKPFRPADAILVAALLVVVGAIVWQQLTPSAVQYVSTDSVADASPEAASIAVLAFDDLSPEGDQEHFSDGISEELLNVLVRVEGLRVASRTSAFRFKGSDASIPEIAADLNVRHVVEGSVRKAGNTIRITAQLIDSESDGHLWSETFDRELTLANVFDVQDEIANAIVAALSEQLGGVLPEADLTVEASTENLTAYELYLQANQLFLAREGLDRAEQLLAEAVALDPAYAAAWELRGAVQMLGPGYGFFTGENDTPFGNAVEYSERALEIDPERSFAIAILSYVGVVSNPAASAEETHQAIMGLSQALELDPRNASALNWRGGLYRVFGFGEQAVADFRACVEIDPYYAACQSNLGGLLANLERYEDAYVAYVEAARIGVASLNEPLALFAYTGRQDQFIRAAAQQFGPAPPWGTNDVLYRMYREPESDFGNIANELIERQDENPFYPFLALMIDVNAPIPANAALYPMGREFGLYRNSPAFQTFVTENGLADYWRAYGFPPQCSERDNGSIECE
jgi:TolB-like protein